MTGPASAVVLYDRDCGFCVRSVNVMLAWDRADGELYSAGAAAAPLVRVLPLGRPLAALLTALPGPTERVYRFIARRRARWARLLGIASSCETGRP